MNYTSKTIKTIVALAFLTTTNLNSFSLFESKQSPKECYIYNKGKLSFLNVLANQSMYVKTGEQIEELLNKLNMSGNNSKFFINGRKDIVHELLNIRYRRSSPIPKDMLFKMIDEVEADKNACIKRKKASKTLSRGW